jgi:hypothetical protein
VPFLDEYREAPGLPATITLHLLVTMFTVLMAALSKSFFEDKFLWYKRRFQAVNGRSSSVKMVAKTLVSEPESLAA